MFAFACLSRIYSEPILNARILAKYGKTGLPTVIDLKMMPCFFINVSFIRKFICVQYFENFYQLLKKF